MAERIAYAGEAGAGESLGYRPLQDILRERVRQAILDGTSAPGARLNTYTIARQYGVSPVPVREALRALEAEGLVEFSPNRGAVVKALSVDELRETFFIRIALVTAATREAVRKMSDADVAALAALLAEAAAVPADSEERTRLNFAFHRYLHEAAHMPRLVEILDRLTALASLYQRLSAERGDAAQLQAEHAAILEACRQRDGNRAAKLMERHLADTRDLLIASLKRIQPRPQPKRRAR